MKLIFVGPQGSGKGTQAKKIAEKFGLCHISSGDMLREVVDGRLQVTGGLAEEVKKCIEKGKLVSDDLIVKILKERILSKDCEKGFILDGFPRTARQAEMLEGISNIDKVFEIAISDEESVRRISGRRGCEKCGAIFNINTSPKPAVERVCDVCGGELTQRKDDNEDALRERLKIYNEEMEGILKMYDSVKINGEQSIEEVGGDILRALG